MYFTLGEIVDPIWMADTNPKLKSHPLWKEKLWKLQIQVWILSTLKNLYMLKPKSGSFSRVCLCLELLSY